MYTYIIALAWDAAYAQGYSSADGMVRFQRTRECLLHDLALYRLCILNVGTELILQSRKCSTHLHIMLFAAGKAPSVLFPRLSPSMLGAMWELLLFCKKV